MRLVLLNLGYTLLLEIPVLLLFFRKQWKTGLLFGILMNAFTLPLVSLAIYEWGVNWYAGELGVLIAEFILIWIWFRPQWWYALLAAFVTNVFSAFFFRVFPDLYWY